MALIPKIIKPGMKHGACPECRSSKTWVKESRVTVCLSCGCEWVLEEKNLHDGREHVVKEQSR